MKITSLYVYPIKGIRGIPLDSAILTPQGIQHDRRFMLFTTLPSGQLKKMQLASFPSCALFSQRLAPSPTGTTIEVTYHPPDSMQPPPPLVVPLQPDHTTLTTLPITMYNSSTNAYRMGDPYDTWFSTHFSLPVLFVYLGDGRRPVLGKSMPPPTSSSLLSYFTNPTPPWITFTDVAPYLITSLSSLTSVNTRLPSETPVPMYKFRPNIVVDGQDEDAWAEDYWGTLEIYDSTGTTKKGGWVMTSNCGRCSSLNVDYDTGKQAEGELGTVLKKLQADRRVDSGTRWSPIFGRYGFLDGNKEIGLSIGDEVRVGRRNGERSVWDWPM